LKKSLFRGGREPVSRRTKHPDFPFRNEPPPIPDYEILRCIGKGSYGEVWMARSVTGSLRAVKVVHRKDFELERTFEREFDGIKSFEPISRNHPGLVDILHVGRNLEHNFYYCVMELGDDVEMGQEINPAEYAPRMLGGMGSGDDVRERLTLEQCLDYGEAMASALGHLHEQGLSHRDIKPSNVIFVNGTPKLADVGLVAVSGQRTYVGTEGFTPPEGPGTPQADVYSLGMVLYELSTGKDRMEFPELPEDLGFPKEKEKWLALNEVICKACAPVTKRRYETATQMSHSLRDIATGRFLPAKFPKILAAPILGMVFAAGIVAWKSDGRAHWAVGSRASPGDGSAIEAPVPIFELGSASAVITSRPEGASVYRSGELEGVTPLTLRNLSPGPLYLTLTLPDYKEIMVRKELQSGINDLEPFVLEYWSPPEEGKAWTNSVGMRFEPRSKEHIALYPTTYFPYVDWSGGSLLEGEVVDWVGEGGNGSGHHVVIVPSWDAAAFCEWLTKKDQAEGYLGEEHRYRAELVMSGIESSSRKLGPAYAAFRCVVAQPDFGQVTVRSNPQGAEVYGGDELLGTTPLDLPAVEAGEIELELRLPGYKFARISGRVRKNERVVLYEPLKLSGAAVFGKPWENGQRMRFVPLGGDSSSLLLSVYETRLRDYEKFVRETARPATHVTDFSQKPSHPVVNVSRADAEAFCAWLTARERAGELIGEEHVYRLPGDQEWSLAAGIRNERGTSPARRGELTFGIFPWGFDWPPRSRAGNFADARYRRELRRPRDESIGRYEDGAPYTAPVGSYSPAYLPADKTSPEAYKIYDLAGNAAEWISEPFGGDDELTRDFGVVRGGSWSDHQRGSLRSTARQAVPVDGRDSRYGFRVVLENLAPPFQDVENKIVEDEAFPEKASIFPERSRSSVPDKPTGNLQFREEEGEERLE